MITAILIDDDENLRRGMKGLLALYASNIKIIGEADSVASGIEAITKYQPQVVFLDIQLNDGTGFDILEQLATKNGKTTSHIVFITAHEQYAIKAFRFSALDFLLKPVDPDELQKVIAKIKDVLEKTDYTFTLEDGSEVTLKGSEFVEYEGEQHNVANLYDALKEGIYGNM
jgi:two-component system LytT family response regulator